jgi:alpha-L-arabinofuranosidase
VLLDSPDGTGLQVESGNWSKSNGSFVQSGPGGGMRAFAGDKTWSSYTLTLKARKISGNEGFLITVGRGDKGNYVWWNLGGWGNREHGFEITTDGGKSQFGQHADGRIETGKWYDLKVEYSPDRIKTYLDGKLMFNEALVGLKPVHAVTGVDSRTGEAILKIVNVGDRAIDLDIDLASTGWRQIRGNVEVLRGDNKDENTVENPRNVAPYTRTIGKTNPKFRYRLDPRSLSVLRISKAS